MSNKNNFHIEFKDIDMGINNYLNEWIELIRKSKQKKRLEKMKRLIKSIK